MLIPKGKNDFNKFCKKAKGSESNTQSGAKKVSKKLDTYPKENRIFKFKEFLNEKNS